MKYVVVFERGPNNWGAYVPDLPGCVALGDTREDTEQLIRDAIELHLRDLRERGEPVPEPSTQAGLVEVA